MDNVTEIGPRRVYTARDLAARAITLTDRHRWEAIAEIGEGLGHGGDQLALLGMLYDAGFNTGRYGPKE